jgi:hypothetical protein
MTRLFDESILLPHGPAGTWVEGASIGFVLLGLGFVPWLLWRDRAGLRQRVIAGLVPSDPWVNPERPPIDGEEHDGEEQDEDEHGGEGAEQALDDARVHDDPRDDSVRCAREPDEVRAGSDDLA